MVILSIQKNGVIELMASTNEEHELEIPFNYAISKILNSGRKFSLINSTLYLTRLV